MIYISILHYVCFAIIGQMSVIAVLESHYEVTPVKHTINETETIARLSVEIVINNATTRFDLQSVEGYFAGENTKVYMLNKTKYYELENIMKEVNISFYQDKETLSSVSHFVNKKGVSEFTGVIDSDKVISPLTESARKRYNISQHLFSQADSNDANYHIIRQKDIGVEGLTAEKSQDSKHGVMNTVFPELLIFVDKSLLQHFENNTVKTLAHTLTMLNGADLYFRIIEDTRIRLNIAGIVLCQLHFSHDMWETVNGEKKLKEDAVPTIFPIPKVKKRKCGVIVVRSRKKMKKDENIEEDEKNISEITRPTLEKEKVALNNHTKTENINVENLSPTLVERENTTNDSESSYPSTICTQLTSESKIQDNMIKEEKFIVSENNVKQFGNFMYQQTKFKLGRDYDIAILIGTNSFALNVSLGIAPIGGACYSNHITKMVYSVAFVLDIDFSGIRTTAHELTHLFGVLHDGEVYDTEVNRDICPFEEGHVMSYGNKNKNKFFFSTCSQKVMNEFFSNKTGDCLRNNPADNRKDKQILRILPGKYMSVDEQCKEMGYIRALRIDKSICLGISCVKKERTEDRGPASMYFWNVSALEGGPCGPNKYCFKGECVEVEVDHEGTIDTDLFFPSYSSLNTAKRPQAEVKYNLQLNLNSFSLKVSVNRMNLIAIFSVKYLYDTYLSF